jgi:hypothetical protein
MKAPKYHAVDFRRNSGKDIATWDQFRAPGFICDTTQLRMLATRLRVSQPRTLTETPEKYAKRIATILMQRGRSHLSEEETAEAIKGWYYPPQRPRTQSMAGAEAL